MRLTIPFILAAAAALLLTAAAVIFSARGAETVSGDLAVISAWARATPPGAEVGAAYVTVVNRGGAADRLVGASTPAAETTELHETVAQDGVARMRPLDAPTIPAGGKLEMLPGGIHFMLMGLSAPLKEGDAVPITLRFERGGEITVEAEIAPVGAHVPNLHDHAM
jgi:copper(I)-binding protein